MKNFLRHANIDLFIDSFFVIIWAIFLTCISTTTVTTAVGIVGICIGGIFLGGAVYFTIRNMRRDDDSDGVKINFVKNHVNAHVPTRGSEEAAGYDLYSSSSYDIHIAPHQTVKIDTGIACELPSGTFGAIFARSGLATKKSLRPANCVGVIDSDYRGSYIVALHNDSDEIQTVEPGERIAQLVLLPYIPMNFNEVHKLDSTARGAGSFGSTGTK